jgi:excisionase family DNA binding protein
MCLTVVSEERKNAKIQEVKMKDKLYTFKEVCSLLSISPASLNRFLKKQLIEAYKIGYRWRFSQDQIDTYLEKNKIEAIKLQ